MRIAPKIPAFPGRKTIMTSVKTHSALDLFGSRRKSLSDSLHHLFLSKYNFNQEAAMYGLNGCYTALEWLAMTGNPSALSENDREKFGLQPLANSNVPPQPKINDVTTDSPD